MDDCPCRTLTETRPTTDAFFRIAYFRLLIFEPKDAFGTHIQTTMTANTARVIDEYFGGFMMDEAVFRQWRPAREFINQIDHPQTDRHIAAEKI